MASRKPHTQVAILATKSYMLLIGIERGFEFSISRQIMDLVAVLSPLAIYTGICFCLLTAYISATLMLSVYQKQKSNRPYDRSQPVLLFISCVCLTTC